jgi:hypothetical protein
VVAEVRLQGRQRRGRLAVELSGEAEAVEDVLAEDARLIRVERAPRELGGDLSRRDAAHGHRWPTREHHQRQGDEPPRPNPVAASFALGHDVGADDEPIGTHAGRVYERWRRASTQERTRESAT